MARRVTLVKLLDDLRAKLHVSLNPAHNAQVRDKQVKALQSTQEWLWEDFTWPHLRVSRNYKLQAGLRFYDFSADFDISRIERIEVRDGASWLPVTAGIEAAHYSVWDSELDKRSWPVRRWRISEDEQVEVWPIADRDGDPATLDGYLKVTGIRKLNPLVADADRCDLDSQLIYLYAASELAPDTKEGKIALNVANRRMARLKGNLTPRRQFKMFGIGEQREGVRKLFVGAYRPPGA